MAPFQYDTYRNAQAGSIAELMARRGDIAAKRAESVGQIQGRAAEQSGNAWAGAIGNVGQTVAAIPGQLQQQKRAATVDEANTLKLGEEKRAVGARSTLAKVMQDTPKLSEDGVSVWDVPAITRAMADQGFGPEAGSAAQQLDGINTSFRQARAAQMAVVQKGAQAVAAAGNDPTLASHFLDQVEANNLVPAETVAKYREFIKADPANTAKLTAYIMGPQKMERGAPGSVAVSPITGMPVPGSAVPDDPSKGAYTGPDGIRYKADGTAMTGEVMKPQAPAMPTELTPAQKATDERERERIAIDRQKAAASQGDKTDLSPAGIDIAALNFRKTGNLPPLGMGDKTTRKSIINRAATLTPDDVARIEAGGLDIAGNKAGINANADSLKSMQKQRDAIGAFEQTAQKNIDIFLTAAGKIVDTGSPIANGLARQVSGKMLGSPDQAAYDAARQVAINEIAKITSNPTLSGTLSDSARHEVDAFNPANATLKQTVAVMRLLKQDMGNRTKALDDQITTIKGRIGGGTTPVAASGGTIEAKDTQGNIHHAPAGTALPPGWSLVKR